MSAIPIRGRRENIKAELIELANDPSITGIMLGIIRGDADDETLSTICIGKRATCANIVLAAAALTRDALDPEE